MRFFGKTNIDFMGPRRRWYLISLSVIVIGMLSIPLKGGLNYGIDFTGGTEILVQFQQAPNIGDVRTAVSNAGFENVEAKTFGAPERVMIRTETQGEGTSVSDRMKETLVKSFANLQPVVLQDQKIGPKVGKELRNDAFYAVVASLIAMLIYVGFRFKFIYGVGAVVALFHDVLVTLGVISLVNGTTSFTNFEIDQNMIAAFLTLVGLSVNDTVVIFDRIRENQKTYKTMSLSDLMNKSLNETLSRTIITSGTIFIVTVILYLLGGEVNRGFAFAMTIGIITGTYSSIYIASAIVLDYTNARQGKKLQPAVVGKPTYETAK
jgi:preprotein translocase SecF subunit